MNCRRTEELFSDYRDGALTPPLANEVRTHLESCDGCRSLYRAFEEVTDALGGLQVPAMPDSLAAKLASPAHIEIVRARSSRAAPSRRVIAGASWLAVAAALLLMLVLRPPDLASDVSRATSRSARHVYSFTVRGYHRTERWIEDLNVLRMTVAVAFEDRLDQINEQLRDLENAGRRSGDDEQSKGPRELDGKSGVASEPRRRADILEGHSHRSFS